MTLLNPAALFGLLLVPILVIFYLFRPEPRQQQSTTYFLWKQAIPDSQGATFARRLQSNPLLWLQILILLLLVLFLSRLSSPWVNQVPLASRVILILDRSASMSAGGAFERAVKKADAAVDSMLGFRLTGSAPEVMLIAVDREPRVLVPFTQDANALKSALAELRPSDLPDDLERMSPFLRSLIKSHRAKIWIFGDRFPESLHLPGVQFSSVAVSDNDNAGVMSFTVSAPDPSRGQDKPFLYARVENFSDTAQHRLVRIEKMTVATPDRVEAVIFEKTLLLSANSGKTLVESVPASRFEADTASLFRFQLLPIPGEPEDVFPTDNVAYTVVESFRNENVVVATSPGIKATFLLRAIAASRGIKVVELEQVLALPDPPSVDLLLAAPDTPLPSKLKVRSRFTLAPSPQEKEKPEVSRLQLSEKDAPLVSDSGVEWERMKVQITDLRPLKEGELELLQSREGPALTLSGLNEGLPSLHWRFPLEYSSLPLSAGLPVIVGRFIDHYSRNSTVPVAGSLTTAGPFPRPSGHKWRDELWITPLTQKARALGGELEFESQARELTPPEQIGVYTLGSSLASEPLAVNLASHSESKLPRLLEDLNFESDEGSPLVQEDGLSQIQYREVGMLFLLLSLLILLWEAALFLKRGRP